MGEDQDEAIELLEGSFFLSFFLMDLQESPATDVTTL